MGDNRAVDASPEQSRPPDSGSPDVGPQHHLQALDPPAPPRTLSPHDSCPLPPDLHEPTPQVAAQDEADPLHLHLMDADLQVPLLGPPEVFFLLTEKTKFVKNMRVKD